MPQRSQRHREEQSYVPFKLASLNPSSAVNGSTITLVVLGGVFQSGDVIVWDGAVVPTTFVSSGQLSTANLAVGAARIVTVSVRHLNGVVSNSLGFTVT